MSFNVHGDIEADSASVKSSHYKDFPQFESLSQTVDNNLYNLNNNLFVSIKNLLPQYEKLLNEDNITTPSNQVSTRASKISLKISELLSKSTNGFKTINQTTKQLNEYLNECEANHEDEDTLRYLRQKESILIKLIKSSINQFQKYQRKFEALQQVYLRKFDTENRAALIDEESGDVVPAQTSIVGLQQVQITYEPVNAEELEQQTLLIQEREREIHQITQDTTEINEIFQNLQDIVHEQQFSIDNIEDNIINYSQNTKAASNELRRAERYQRRAGGRMFCCLLILLLVLGSIILVGIIF